MAGRSQTQWVYLDFDSFTNPNEEYHYVQADRDAIMARIQEIYYGRKAMEYAAANNADPFFSPSRWFNIRFTQKLSDIPSSLVASGDFIRANFNQTPTFDRPGGQASEVDVSNQSFGGSASIQINGLLGGLLTVEELESEELADIYADAAVGSQKPAATRANFVALATKVAAHEIAHLFGLRHYDAFGPIGFGIHSPPGAGSFKPGYSGPAAAFETFNHIISSPASVGSTRFIDLGKLFFGEREAIKITLATSDLSTVSHTEATASHGEIASAQPLTWATLAVPNTLNSGVNAGKEFFVQAATVSVRSELWGR